MKTRVLLLWLLIIRHVKTDGKLDIRFISYWSDGKENSGRCCDNELPDLCRNTCDPMFCLRIDGQDGRKPRSLYKTTTYHTENHNIIHFGSTIRGTPNPFIIQVPKGLPSSIEIMVQVDDYDDTSGDDHMDTLSKLINIHAAHTEQAAMYTPYTLSRRTVLKIAVRAYCDPDWYGSSCERHCKATPDHSHYTCHPYTGAKMCFEGWKGDNCNQDIDECTETDQICQHGGNCTNALGSFECICVEGVNGTQCENIINQCALEPCLNGGTCDGNETDFSCACPVEWTGEACADKVNFCDSSPCNMGHCTPDLLTAPRFKCDCDFAWVGERCNQSVDIVNITLLGEIGHTNRGDLADGLNRFITELGGIPGTVDVKFTTNTKKESNYTTTYVQLYFAGENGSFLQTDSLARIFESNPDVIINEYLPLPLYPPREEEKATLKSPHDSWDTNQYASAILPPVVLVLMSVLLLVAFCIWRRRSNKMEHYRDENYLSSFAMDVPCNRNLQATGAVTENLQAGYTSLRFLEVDEGSHDTHCDDTSNIHLPPEDMTLDPESLQGFSGYPDDNGRLGDVATADTLSDVTSNIHLVTEDMTLDDVIAQFGVSPVDNARLGDAASFDTNCDDTTKLPLSSDDMTHDQLSLHGFGVSPDAKASLPDMARFQQVSEVLILDPVIEQDARGSPHDNARQGDEAALHDGHGETLDTHCDETVNALPTSGYPDGHARLDEVGTRLNVTSYIHPVPGDMTLDPGSQKGDAEDAEYTVIHDNDVEDLLQEDPYETIESLDDNDVENISQKDPYEKINV